ncbi:olfactory receptor 10A4-like [Ambystoma mexicanum]|uniref:olfactory receptor 10A4-like n=1 Tax=Ambystoma mexicanum TaxID=8296 RepID=UPI0037E95CD2
MSELGDTEHRDPSAGENPGSTKMSFSSIAPTSNQTSVMTFTLVGFSDLSPPLQGFLFLLFTMAYLCTLAGNALIISITMSDLRLNTPMYFLIRNLSFLECIFSTVTVPKLLTTFTPPGQRISLIACATQMFLFSSLGVTECFLLGVMACDRYVAICNPLRYTSIMTQRTCVVMVTCTWSIGFVLALEQILLTFSVTYCANDKINHFFCDFTPVLQLACGDTHVNEISLFINGVFVILLPFLLILFSYVNILSIILRMKSSVGRHKVFSTCGSHLTSVVLFYGSSMVVYLGTLRGGAGSSGKLLSLLYCVGTPLLNPLIYSLRNQEVKRGLRTLITRKLIDLRIDKH